MNKYYARKTEVDGITFDSKHEAERYCELKLLWRAGEIRELMIQYPFELIPAQKDEKGKTIAAQPLPGAPLALERKR